MLRWAILATWITACGGGGAPIGSECSLVAPCEDGATCDLTDPAGAVCIDAGGDLDGDGLQNGDDFCNHAPGGQFDEDADGIGDECDKCPIAPPPAAPDADGDGVDSPCDPEPSEPGDKIVAFDGFNEGLPANWTATAAWSFEGGQAVARPADGITVETLLAPLPLVSQHVAVLARYRVDGVDATATSPFAGVTAVDKRPAGGTEVRCGGARTGAMDRLLLDGSVAVATDDFVTSLFDSTNDYRLALQVDNAAGACALVAKQETGAVDSATSGEAANFAGLQIRAASSRFEYVLVIQRDASNPD